MSLWYCEPFRTMYPFRESMRCDQGHALQLADVKTAAEINLTQTTSSCSNCVSLTAEIQRLQQQLANHCACTHDGRGSLVTECEEHRIIREQRDKWLINFNRSEQFQNGPTKRAEAAEEEAKALREQLEPYLKDGETPAECVARNRADVDVSLTLLASEKLKTEAAEEDLRRLRAQIAEQAHEIADIYQGFELESLNGVVCSIPDEGLSTAPHRTWCFRCKARWTRFAQAGNALLALLPAIPESHNVNKEKND